MQGPKDSDAKFVRRRAVKETILLSVVFLVTLLLFFSTVYFIAAKEVDAALQNRPRGLGLGWLTMMTIGLILGKTRQEEAVSLPKSLWVVRESLQAIMLLLFFGVLCYASYFFYTSRGLLVQRPWGLLIGWFAFLILIAFFVKTKHVIGRYVSLKTLSKK